MDKVMMYPSNNVRFKIHSIHGLWGFYIDVIVRSDNRILESYCLDQVYGSVHDDAYCSWRLRKLQPYDGCSLKHGGIYDDPILIGRLVYGRTDSFAPLMKCLKFLEKKGE